MKDNKMIKRVVIILGIMVTITVLTVLFLKKPEEEKTETVYDSPTEEELSPAIHEGILNGQSSICNQIIDKLNECYPELSFKKENGDEVEEGYYLFASEEDNHYEITIRFMPSLEEYKEVLIPYISSINGVLYHFDKEEVDLRAFDFDEEKEEFTPNENTFLLIEKANAEYYRTDTDNYLSVLKDESGKVFSLDDNLSSWSFNTYYVTLEKEKTHYYKKIRQMDPDTKKINNIYMEVSENDDYDHTEKQTYTVEKLMGEITVSLNCNLSFYRKDELSELTHQLTGKEAVYVNIEGEEEKRELTVNQANGVVYTSALSSFKENNHLSLSQVTMSGHVGTVTSNGWDYSTYSNKDIVASEEFWKYSQSMRGYLLRYPYANIDYQGSMPDNYTCSIFAAIFFYDVYGFSALRGDGVRMADNLLKDCGLGGDNACPIQFVKSDSVSPGAIISLYPNHVACVVSVNEDGSFVIADGNIIPYHYIRTGKTYNSLEEYCRENGASVKVIAIPVR